MLNQLSVSNFAIVDEIEIEPQDGMTVITGETGAGKSIMIDALALALGTRAETNIVRSGEKKADINANFDISSVPQAQAWLRAHEFLDEDDNDCLLRRVITSEGRSKAYINGQPATLSQLKAVGEFLVDIHSQHEHQSLLRKDTHRRLLDNYSGAKEQAMKVAQAFSSWHQSQKQWLLRKENNAESQARVQLLSYQAQELQSLALDEGELAKLEQEQKRLSNATNIIESSQSALTQLVDDEQFSSLTLTQQALSKLRDLDESQIENVIKLLEEANILLDEAGTELHDFVDHFEADPERALAVEQRLQAIYDCARKQRLFPEQLLEFQQQVEDELAELDTSDAALDQLQAQVQQLWLDFSALAEKLSKKRQQGGNKLAKAVTAQLHELGMTNAQFSINISTNDSPSASGLEHIEFLIAANPGQPPQAINKVASGGELSRISLAIQVISAEKTTLPTLIFDEVDVGIGGAIAEVVGRLLRKIGSRGQVLCVTHQPQVAAQGHNHWVVSKGVSKKSTHTEIKTLTATDKVKEVARMLGGVEMTEQTLAHAKEMIGG